MRAIRTVLDRAADEGRTRDVWWRDDDAVAPTLALDRLLDLARARDLPVAIAAVPAEAGPDLAARLAAEPGVDVLVHGWRHRNHEPAPAKSAEFGPARDEISFEVDAMAGLRACRDRFGERALPVFVPPWNRIAPHGPALLARAGYRGLSVFGRRRPASPLRVVNTHLDPVDWRGGRGPVPPERLADALAGAITGDEPVGLLTHHLTAGEPVWTLVTELLDELGRHPAVRWTRAGALWPAPASLNRRQIDDLTCVDDARGRSTA